MPIKTFVQFKNDLGNNKFEPMPEDTVGGSDFDKWIIEGSSEKFTEMKSECNNVIENTLNKMLKEDKNILLEKTHMIVRCEQQESNTFIINTNTCVNSNTQEAA